MCEQDCLVSVQRTVDCGCSVSRSNFFRPKDRRLWLLCQQEHWTCPRRWTWPLPRFEVSTARTMQQLDARWSGTPMEREGYLVNFESCHNVISKKHNNHAIQEENQMLSKSQSDPSKTGERLAALASKWSSQSLLEMDRLTNVFPKVTGAFPPLKHVAARLYSPFA